MGGLQGIGYWEKIALSRQPGLANTSRKHVNYIPILALVVVQATLPSNQYPPRGSAEQRALYEEGQARQAEFEQRLFVDAGFEPINVVAAEERLVLRALLQDPYMILPFPGVEIEKHSDSTITLEVIDQTGKNEPTLLEASAWSRLIDLQGNLLEPRPYVPWDPPGADAPLPPVPPICHGWIVRFGKADKTGVGSGSWAACGGGDEARAAYAVEFARLAVSTRPNCEFDQAKPFWSFKTCFSLPQKQEGD